MDPRPARTDLTDRECIRLIGGLIGGLTQMADVDTVRAAVRWWAETDEAWVALQKGISLGTSLVVKETKRSGPPR